MEGWQLATAVIGVFIAILAVVGPALVILGIRLGENRASTRAAHHRLDSIELRHDRLEELLAEKFDDMKQSLNGAIREAYRWCPLAQKGSHGEDKSEA
jgi:hypothetical protein